LRLFAILTLGLMILIFSGCGSGGGGSSAPAKIISQEQSEALEQVRLKQADFPELTCQPLGDLLERTQGSFGENQIFKTLEEWKNENSGFKVYYSVYDSESQAAQIFNSSMANHPLKPTLKNSNSRVIGEINRENSYQIYICSGKVIINLVGPDKDLLSQACGKLSGRAKSEGSSSKIAIPSVTTPRYNGQHFGVLSHELFRVRNVPGGWVRFSPMPIINGVPTAFLSSDDDGSEIRYINGIQPEEMNDWTLYSQGYQYTIPNSDDQSESLYANKITQVWSSTLPGHQTTFNYNDGKSYTGDYVIRHIDTNSTRYEDDGNGHQMLAAHHSMENYTNYYENYTYSECDGYLGAMGLTWYGGYITPGKWQVMDEAYENEQLMNREIYPFCARGFYIKTPNQNPVWSDSSCIFKFNFKLIGIPTPPINDGFDDEGWEPLNPKWRFIIYDKSGNQVWITTGQIQSLGAKSIPLEITWNGQDNQGKPVAAGEYDYKLHCLDQSPGMAHGAAEGQIKVDSVLELYDNHDNLLATSKDTTIPLLLDIHNNSYLKRTQSIILRKHSDGPTTIKVKLKNVRASEQITIKVKAEKSQPEPQTVTLSLKSDGNYSGIFTVGPEGSLLPLKRFPNSYTMNDSAPEGRNDDSTLFSSNYPLDDGTANGYKNLGFAHNVYQQITDGQTLVSNNSIKAAGYEDIIVTADNPCTARLHISNQATELYYTGHGFTGFDIDASAISISQNGDLFGLIDGLRKQQYFYCMYDNSNDNNDLKEEWKDNLKIAILACCEVLDIRNFNQTRRFDDAPGALWATKLNPGSILLGYNALCRTPVYILDIYFEKVREYQSQGLPCAIPENIRKDLAQFPQILAWLIANSKDIFMNSSACGVIARNPNNSKIEYYYFIKSKITKITTKKAIISRKIVRVHSDFWIPGDMKPVRFEEVLPLPKSIVYLPKNN